MKKLLIMASLFLAMTASAQKVYNLDAPKTEQELIGKSVKTSDQAVYKTVSYPVYKTSKNKLFIVYVNKKGNYSKKYIN